MELLFICSVFVTAALLVYILTRPVAQLWKDAFHNEVERHDQTRAALLALDASHADLQREYLKQGRELTMAQALAKAAERAL